MPAGKLIVQVGLPHHERPAFMPTIPYSAPGSPSGQISAPTSITTFHGPVIVQSAQDGCVDPLARTLFPPKNDAIGNRNLVVIKNKNYLQRLSAFPIIGFFARLLLRFF